MNEEIYTYTYETKPTKDNIYYMFQRLILPIIISMQYEPYKNYWQNFNNLFILVNNWIKTYFNENDLTKINQKEIDDADDLIADLKFACLEIDTEYIEEIDIWYGEFLSILSKAGRK